MGWFNHPSRDGWSSKGYEKMFTFWGGSNKRCKNVGRHFFFGFPVLNLVHSLDLVIQRPLSSLNFRDDELLWIFFVPYTVIFDAIHTIVVSWFFIEIVPSQKSQKDPSRPNFCPFGRIGNPLHWSSTIIHVVLFFLDFEGDFNPHICPIQMSNEKNPGCLGYIGDFTAQLYGDYHKPLYGSLLNNRGSNVFFCFYIPFLESMQDKLITAQNMIWLVLFSLKVES